MAIHDITRLIVLLTSKYRIFWRTKPGRIKYPLWALFLLYMDEKALLRKVLRKVVGKPLFAFI